MVPFQDFFLDVTSFFFLNLNLFHLRGKEPHLRKSRKIKEDCGRGQIESNFNAYSFICCFAVNITYAFCTGGSSMHHIKKLNGGQKFISF